MKKLISILAVLCTLCILMSSCSFVPLMENPITKTTSTTESEDSSAPGKDDVKAVAELYRRIEDATEALESYTIDEKAKTSVTVEGVKIESDAVSNIVVYNHKSIGLRYKAVSETLTRAGLQGSVSLKEETCYEGGHIYLKRQSDDYLHFGNILAPMTEERFMQYLEEESFDIKGFLEECGESEWSRDDNGYYMITAQKGSQRSIDDFSEKTGYDAELFGVKIEDVKLSISADENFCLQRVIIQTVFEQGGGEPPVMTIQLNYTDHNKTRAPSRPLDTGYKKIDSFDLIEDLEKLLEGIKVSENGSFVRKMTQESKRSSYSDATLIMSEDSQVSYETKDKKLTFTANAQTKVPSAYEGALETVLEYADGTLVSTDPVNGKVSAQQSEEDARVFINSLMIPDAFDRDLLTDISFNGNAYIVRGTPSNTLTFRQELGAAGANVTDATYHANISVRDGKVTKILITLTYVFSSDRMVYTYDITYN